MDVAVTSAITPEVEERGEVVACAEAVDEVADTDDASDDSDKTEDDEVAVVEADTTETVAELERMLLFQLDIAASLDKLLLGEMML